MPAKDFSQFVSKLLQKFEERGISEESPYCHKNDWLIMDWSGGSEGIYIKPTKRVLELGVPFVMLTCSNCGNIRFIDPNILGLIHQSASASNTTEKDNGQKK